MSDYYITASSKSAKKSAESPKLSETSPSDEVDTASDVDGSSVSIEDEQTDDGIRRWVPPLLLLLAYISIAQEILGKRSAAGAGDGEPMTKCDSV